MPIERLQERIISVTDAAEEKCCGRATIYRAIEDNRLTGIELGGRQVVLQDKKYEDFVPRCMGTRVTPIS